MSDATSQESLRTLARRYGINQKTVAKWKERTSVADLPIGPKEPHSTVLSLEDEAVIVAFRCRQGLFQAARLMGRDNSSSLSMAGSDACLRAPAPGVTDLANTVRDYKMATFTATRDVPAHYGTQIASVTRR